MPCKKDIDNIFVFLIADGYAMLYIIAGLAKYFENSTLKKSYIFNRLIY